MKSSGGGDKQLRSPHFAQELSSPELRHTPSEIIQKRTNTGKFLSESRKILHGIQEQAVAAASEGDNGLRSSSGPTNIMSRRMHLQISQRKKTEPLSQVSILHPIRGKDSSQKAKEGALLKL